MKYLLSITGTDGGSNASGYNILFIAVVVLVAIVFARVVGGN